MWFVGIILGLLAGAAVFGFEGALLGAFFGWLLGMVIGQKRRSANVDEERLTKIEQRLALIETQLDSTTKNRLSNEKVEPVQQGQLVGARAISTPVATPVDSSSPPSPATSSVTVAAEIAATSSKSEGTEVKPVSPPPVQASPVPASPAKVKTTPAPAVPAVPPAPNPIVAWFTGGNTIVRVGVVILFIGVAFLVKYAAEQDFIPIEMRLAATALGAIALLVVGWRLREKRAGYALTLQGAGVGILYLTIFGAFRLYHLLPPELAFGLLVLIAALSAVLAVRQNALALAVAGTAGGFLAPVLASTGSGNHVMLFSYYAVLNASIFAIAWYKAWRPLNLLGFIFTFVIGLMWGARYYRAELFASTEPFLILFFLFYVAITVLYALKQDANATPRVDGTLTFGTPLIGFGLQAALVKDFEHGLAFSSLTLAVFYVGLAYFLYARHRHALRLLVESMLALGIIFATLTIPLALDARWTSASWALEGAGIIWLGIRQHRLLARLFGLLLQLFAGIAFLNAMQNHQGVLLLANPIFIGASLLAVAGLMINALFSRYSAVISKGETFLRPLLFWWGLGWWLFAGLNEIDRFVTGKHEISAAILFFTATALAFSLMWRRLSWREAQWPVLLFMPALILTAMVSAFEQKHFFAYYGWLVWPLAFVAHYWLLHRHDPAEPSAALGRRHALGILLLALIGAWEMHWLAEEYNLAHSAWSVASFIVVPGLLLLVISNSRVARYWPMVRYEMAYLSGAGIPLVIGLWLWMFYANIVHDGSSAPLPYLPLFNAIDLGHLYAFMAIGIWGVRTRNEDMPPPEKAAVYGLAGMTIFAWMNAMLLRSLHHWAGIPYQLPALLDSILVQMALSLFWAVMALTLMIFATHKGKRAVWIIGGVLLGVVVGKLFLVDLSHIGGIERIVSFIGVGVLMLVVGYFSPLPPREERGK